MRFLRVLATALIVTASTDTFAGDLVPPGAPAPTAPQEARTPVNLVNTPGDANSRFRITSSGSYYLTGNITLGTAVNAIEIGASNVTLDLNGFTLSQAFAIISPPLNGVVADDGLQNITVRNGVVRAFAETGINLFDASSVVARTSP